MIKNICQNQITSGVSLYNRPMVMKFPNVQFFVASILGPKNEVAVANLMDIKLKNSRLSNYTVSLRFSRPEMHGH